MSTDERFPIKLQDLSIENRINFAINWVLHSGIQNQSGYFHGWYDLESRRYPFIYSEMIGYGAQTLLYLYSRDKRKLYLEKAIKTIDWLLDNMKCESEDPNSKGAFRSKYFFSGTSKKGFFDNNVYTFDTGMCLRALLNVFRITRKQRYLDAAEDAAKWMINVMQNSDGSFKACYNLQSKQFGNSRWSTQPGAHHSKVSIGLLELFEITQDKSLRQSVVRLCNWVLKMLRAKGFLRMHTVCEDIYFHPFCYAIEGLLFAGNKLFIKKYEETAYELATKWLTSAQKTNGAISRWRFKSGKYSDDENTETLAQAIRILSIINQQDITQSSLLTSSIEMGIQRLTELQYIKNDDNRAKGGFFYAILNGNVVPHINCCATLFSLQALQMYIEQKKQNFSSEYYLDNII